MNPRNTAAVALRVLTQLRRDPRTLAMLLVLPCAVLTLLWWMFPHTRGGQFDRLAPALLALVPFTVMFLVTSVTTLRERTSGTLERLLAMPLGRGDLLAGYAVAFGLAATVQAAAAVALTVGPLGLDLARPAYLLALVAITDAVLGTALGLLVSAFARTEFQAVQFMPVVVIPQLLLCGLFRPRAELPDVLRQVSDVLPLSYATDAMSAVAGGGSIGRDLLVVLGYAAAGLVAGSLTLRRRTD